MTVALRFLLVAWGAMSLACAGRELESAPDIAKRAPVATVVPKELEAHGDVRVDDYYWLRNRDDPSVIDYL